MQLVRADGRLGRPARSRRRRPAGSSSGEISVADDVEQRRAGPRRRTRSRAAQSHQELHQRLGDADVRVVHAHVVGVVGTPAQGQLGHVAGADHEAGVHQQAASASAPARSRRPGRGASPPAGAAACSVSASTSSPSRSMPNGAWPSARICSRHSRADVDLAGRDAELPHQRAGRCRVVRPVVPKPGMVRPWMRSRGTPSTSSVLQATSRASVESRPPETPMATRPACRCAPAAAPGRRPASGRSPRQRSSQRRPGRAGRTGAPRRRAAARGSRGGAFEVEADAAERPPAPRYSGGVAEAVGPQAVVREAVEVDVGDEQRVARARKRSTRPAACRSRR